MSDEVLDAPMEVAEDLTVAAEVTAEDVIEDQLQQFRDAKKGTAEADMITPLRDAENVTFYAIVHEDGEEGVGVLDDGWKVSAASHDGSLTLFKPKLKEDGSLHVKTLNMDISEFNRTQDIAENTNHSDAEKAALAQERLIKVNKIMEAMKRTAMPDWNERGDLK